MPARFIIILVLSVFWLAGCASAPAGVGTGANRPGRVTVIHGDLPALANGMSAVDVRMKLGEPAEIKPMPSPEGNIEVWVYYLEKYLGRTEVVTYVDRPAPIGMFANDPYAMIPEPVYTLVDHKLLVTLRLLMLDDRIFSQTTRSELLLGS